MPIADQISADARRAFKVFVVGALLLLFGSATGLNSWPLHDVVSAAATGDPLRLYGALLGYAGVPVVLFWASRPAPVMQWLVLGTWIACSIGLEQVWRQELNIGWVESGGVPPTIFLMSTLMPGCLLALIWRMFGPPPAGADPVFETRLRWLVLLAMIFLVVPSPALEVTAALHPATFDLHLAHWDRAAGLNFTPSLIAWIDAVPALPQAVGLAYNLTPLGFLAVCLLQLRGKPDHAATAVLVWVILTTSALLAYQLLPVTGPKYAFGGDDFAKVLGSPNLPALAEIVVAPAPRNGMPSMHFGWCVAVCILWRQTTSRRRSLAVLMALTGLTAVATLYLGEHYLIDLIVAVPFVLACVALGSTSVRWRYRSAVVWGGLGTWLLWVLLLRYGMSIFVQQTWFCWAMLLLTGVSVLFQWRRVSGFGAAMLAADQDAAGAQTNDPPRDRLIERRMQRFGLLFFASGAAALVYQVLFAKELALVFGSTATATFTVLATFLGGMAIGSLFGGRLAQRCVVPLRWYAAIELGIALYCVATPKLFDWLQSGYVALASGMPPDDPMLLLLRVVMGASVLLIPTVLMGTTLPLLAQATGPQAGRFGERVAKLYFANTAGAAFGALVTTYFVIATLGVNRTTLIAAVLNLLVALGALELAKAEPDHPVIAGGADEIERASRQLPVGRQVRMAALLALGIVGLLSLGLEVVYVHLLSIVAGNSTYAFGLMVATFLTGLSLGGEGARRLFIQPRLDTARGLAWMLLGLSATVATCSLLWNAIPGYFASYASYDAARTFASREVIRGLVCALVMIPPSMFIGAIYVLAMDMFTTVSGERKASALGLAAFVNTLGNIAGVLIFGFILLPWLGGLGASKLIASAALCLATVVLILTGRMRGPSTFAPLALAAGALALTSQARLDYGTLSSGANVYFAAQDWGKVIDHSESIDGGLTTVTAAGNGAESVLTLLTNGKFQGNDSYGGEMQAQVGFALAPLLHQPQRERALVIGYGTGVTTRVFSDAGFSRVDVAELSRDIARLADRHFAKVNLGASSRPNVAVHFTDGRNLLLLSPDRYDVVSLEITSIWFAGAASLYNREFYSLARSRLKDDGVLQQWVQLHRLSTQDLLHVIATLRSEFRFVSLYIIGSQGILVSTNSPGRANPSDQAMLKLRGTPSIAELQRIVNRDMVEVAGDRVLAPSGTDRFLSEVGHDPKLWISTDDNLRLEYDTPRANVRDGTKTLEWNKAMLQRFK